MSGNLSQKFNWDKIKENWKVIAVVSVVLILIIVGLAIVFTVKSKTSSGSQTAGDTDSDTTSPSPSMGVTTSPSPSMGVTTSPSPSMGVTTSPSPSVGFTTKTSEPTPEWTIGVTNSPGTTTSGTTTSGTTTSGSTTSGATTPTPFISNVRYIDFYQDQPTWVNIAEICAYTPGSELNIIPGSNATISEINNKPYLGGYPYTNIIDGRVDTFGHEEDNNNTIPFVLRIDLKSDKTLSKIILTNRLECCRQRVIGGSIRLRDSNLNELYRSEKFKSVDGRTTYDNPIEQNDNNNGLVGSYLYYTMFLPNTNPIGSNFRINYGFISNIKYIQIIQEQNVALNLAEIRAFEVNSDIDIIPTNTESVYEISGKPTLDIYPWSNIVNGDYGSFGHHGTNTPCTVEIALKQPKNLSIIDLVNREDCCRMRVLGAYFKLLDSYRNVLYVSDKMRDKSGSEVYVITREQDDYNNGMSGSWYVYTMLLPKKEIYPSNFGGFF